jgi:hypothetical protein
VSRTSYGQLTRLATHCTSGAMLPHQHNGIHHIKQAARCHGVQPNRMHHIARIMQQRCTHVGIATSEIFGHRHLHAAMHHLPKSVTTSVLLHGFESSYKLTIQCGYRRSVARQHCDTIIEPNSNATLPPDVDVYLSLSQLHGSRNHRAK